VFFTRVLLMLTDPSTLILGLPANRQKVIAFIFTDLSLLPLIVVVTVSF
jgi:hypothetical protein